VFVAMLDALLLAARLQATPIPPPPRLELRVVPDCRYCAMGEEIDFHTFYRLDGEAIEVQRSILEVEDVDGKLLFAFENPFCRQPGERLPAGYGTSNCAAPALLERLAALPAGDYAVTWRLNDVASNSAGFRVGRTIEPPVPLVIQPLLRHGETMPQPEFLAHFTNTGAATLSLPGLWGESSLIVDGVAYHRSGWIWCGTANLGPGASWGVVVPLGEYGSAGHCAVRAGRHQVQFVMGGERSNVITVEIAGDDCRERMRP
jgi:hypothetical protein